MRGAVVGRVTGVVPLVAETGKSDRRLIQLLVVNISNVPLVLSVPVLELLPPL